MFGATELILSSSLSHSVGTRCAVRAKMAGSWAVRIPVHDEVGTASSRMIPCSSRPLQLPAPRSQLRLPDAYYQLPGLCDISGDAVKPMIITIIRSGSLGWGGPGARHPTDVVLASHVTCECVRGQATSRHGMCVHAVHAIMWCSVCRPSAGASPPFLADACFRPVPTPPGNAIVELS